MPAFSYVALDSGGRQTKGILEADSNRQIRQQLREKGFIPLEIRRLTHDNQRQAAGDSKALLSFRVTLSVSALAMLMRQLATLVQAGMPLEESLNAVAQQTESSKVRGILLSVRSRVMEGHDLASSLAEFPRAFPLLLRATVAAGEQSGHLDIVLSKLADYSEKSYASRQKALLALLYPMLLLLMSITIVTGLMAFVVPDVVEVFIGQGQSLPALTQGLINLSDFIVNYGALLLLLLLLIVVAVRYALRQAVIKLQCDRYLLTLPLFGRLIQGGDTSRYSSTLAILTSSGVPLVEAMDIASQVLNNTWIKHQVLKANQTVREGGGLHQALEKTDCFPPMMIHMIASGESSGELDAMLGRVADFQQNALDNLVAMVVGLFEPLMLLFMGGAVLIIVVAILQPIFELNNLL